MLRIRDSVKIPGRPRVIYWLLGLNLIAFMAQGQMGGDAILAGGMIPADFFHPEAMDPNVAEMRPPALVTVFWSMFLHAGLWHLFMNMLVLVVLGPNIEAQMGRVRFTLFYLACGCAGALLQAVTDPASTTPVIGASGALSGLLGAYLVLFTDHHIRMTVGPYPRNYRDNMIPFKVILALWIFSQLTTIIFEGGGRIAIFTHIGGFIAGLLLAGSPGVASRRRRFRVVHGGGHPGGTND